MANEVPFDVIGLQVVEFSESLLEDSFRRKLVCRLQRMPEVWLGGWAVDAPTETNGNWLKYPSHRIPH